MAEVAADQWGVDILIREEVTIVVRTRIHQVQEVRLEVLVQDHADPVIPGGIGMHRRHHHQEAMDRVITGVGQQDMWVDPVADVRQYLFP